MPALGGAIGLVLFGANGGNVGQGALADIAIEKTAVLDIPATHIAVELEALQLAVGLKNLRRICLAETVQFRQQRNEVKVCVYEALGDCFGVFRRVHEKNTTGARFGCKEKSLQKSKKTTLPTEKKAGGAGNFRFWCLK